MKTLNQNKSITYSIIAAFAFSFLALPGLHVTTAYASTSASRTLPIATNKPIVHNINTN